MARMKQDSKNKNVIREDFYENGKLRHIGNYKNGIEHGTFETYYQNGNLSRRYHYEDGVICGQWEEYHENGQLLLKFNCRNSLPDGLLERFDENGNFLYSAVYKNGVGTLKNETLFDKVSKILKIK